jgi:hypothetical protein
MERLAVEKPTETKTEKVKQAAKRRTPYIPGLLKAFEKAAEESVTKIQETAKHESEKLSKMAAAIVEAIGLERGAVDRDDQRVRAIINAGLHGIERTLRDLPIMNEGDNREFMRSKGGWKV